MLGRSKCRRRSRSTTTSRIAVPTIEQYEAWLGADLMIKGLQLAGKSPTSSSVIKPCAASPLTTVTASCRTHQFHDDLRSRPPQELRLVPPAKENGFVPVSSQPTCGTDLPGRVPQRELTDVSTAETRLFQKALSVSVVACGHPRPTARAVSSPRPCVRAASGLTMPSQSAYD